MAEVHEEGRPKRERKSAQIFNASPSQPLKEAAIEEGDGVKLGDYDYFVKNLEKHTGEKFIQRLSSKVVNFINDTAGDSDLVKGLHSLMFGFPGKKAETKKHIRSFSGFPTGTVQGDKVSKIADNKKKWNVSLLKDALDLFGLEKGGVREDLVTRLVDYLAKPVVLKNTTSSGRPSTGSSKGTPKAKAKGKTPSKRKSKSKDGPPKKKRAPSAYILFMTATRSQIKKENPSADFGDLTRLTSQKWNELSDEDKEVRWQIL